MICKCFLFFLLSFFGAEVSAGCRKGVCLLWLWNKPPHVNASAAMLAGVLFTVTLSHLIQRMLIASKIVLRWSDPSCPQAVLHLCLKGENIDLEFIFCSHRPPNCWYSSTEYMISHPFPWSTSLLLMSLKAAIFRSKRVSLPTIWRKPSSCFSTPGTQARICSRCISLM